MGKHEHRAGGPGALHPAAHQTIADRGRRRAVLVAVCVALMAVIASVTGLNVAQPDLAVSFGASQHTVLWIINAYTLTLAALLLPLRAVGDRWGRKRVLLNGLALFGTANVRGALAPTAEVMLAARVLSGVGAAMIMPITTAVAGARRSGGLSRTSLDCVGLHHDMQQILGFRWSGRWISTVLGVKGSQVQISGRHRGLPSGKADWLAANVAREQHRAMNTLVARMGGQPRSA